MKKSLIFLITVLLLLSAVMTGVFAEEPVRCAEDSFDTESAELVSVDNASEDNGEALEFEFSTKRLPTSLKHMGIGMAGVFIVLGIIALVVLLLNKASKPKK